jgi:DNA polymerase III epsilon subunit-like protein
MGDVRITSLSIVVLIDFSVYNSRLWVMKTSNDMQHDGDIRMTDLNGLMEQDALGFDEQFGEISGWLEVRHHEPLTVVSHKVAFDVLQLEREFHRMGEALPPMRILDLTRLAEAAGVSATDPSFEALKRELNLPTNLAPTALSGALDIASATVELCTILECNLPNLDLATLIDSLAIPLVPDSEYSTSSHATKEDPLGRHFTSHITDGYGSSGQLDGLNKCLEEDCEFLAQGMRDAINCNRDALQIIDWALSRLEEDWVGRRMSGELLRGVGQVLRFIEEPEIALAIYRSRLAPLLGLMGPCGRKYSERCSPCVKKEGVCEFVGVLRSIVDTLLKENSTLYSRLRIKQVELFLPGLNPAVQKARGRPKEGLYGELRRRGHLDAAGYGAFLVAGARKSEGQSAWAFSILRKAWNDGCRNSDMTKLWVSMIVARGIGDSRNLENLNDSITEAINCLVDFRKSNSEQRGRTFSSLVKFERILKTFVASPSRSESIPKQKSQRREPHVSMLTPST